MERFALAVLLAVFLPSLATGQGLEVALLVSRYQPMPGVQLRSEHVVCDDPCPREIQNRVSWGSGTLIGGRVSLQLDSRFGFDATIQHTHVTNRHSVTWGTESSSSFTDVAATFFVAQPRVRLRLDDSIHATIGVGPVVAFTNTTNPPTGSPDPRLGIALSVALRMPIRRPLEFEVRASDYLYLEAEGSGPRNVHDFVLGIGLAFAFQRRVT